MAIFRVLGALVAAAVLLLAVTSTDAVPIVGTKLQLPPDASGSSFMASPTISYKTEESSAPPCTASTSIEAFSKKEFEEDVLTVFFDLSNRSGILQEQAVNYFAAELVRAANTHTQRKERQTHLPLVCT